MEIFDDLNRPIYVFFFFHSVTYVTLGIEYITFLQFSEILC